VKASVSSPASERGFTLVELLVGTVISVLVLGGAVALSSQVQNGYRRQLESAAAEQEGRYALDWIGRYIRGAGNDPTNINPAVTACPAAATPFVPIGFNPLSTNTLRLMTDVNPADGAIGGTTGNCNQANEDVTISYDATNRAITFLDNNVGAATIRTDAVIDNLQFIYRNSLRQITTSGAQVMYVETRITVRTRTIDSITGQPVTRVLSSEVRVRNR
jgi:prepilin-type N-terminal cleavage/methylation domain-containing protein